ncbi:MAG: hypothetical protein QG646_2418 [Euryarchaeota archaeon]|nr:hypothetical protein [Euryarchaeota archaeon]
MKGKDHHYIPNPKEFTHEILEETKVLCNGIAEGIIHIPIPWI